MAYDHTEQEQLDAIKAWWNQYGNLITWLLIAVLSVVIAWKSWGIYQTRQAGEASVVFEELQKAIQEKDQAKLLRAVTDIQENFPKTTYAQMASLLAAKYAFDANDSKTAKNLLSWVQTNGKAVEFQSLAKIRLAGILLDEKSYDEAMKLLDSHFPSEFLSAVEDRKGDILFAQNKLQEARAAYQLAVDKGDSQRNPNYQYIQLKLDAISGASNKPAVK